MVRPMKLVSYPARLASRFRSPCLACLAAVGPWAAAACSSGEPDLEAERLALLRVAEAVEIDTPYQERVVMLKRLEQLALTDETLRSLRQVCVRGHQSLIDGERGHERAAAALAEVTKNAESGTLTAEQRDSVERELKQSMEAIERAKGPLDECVDRLNSLEVRSVQG